MNKCIENLLVRVKLKPNQEQKLEVGPIQTNLPEVRNETTFGKRTRVDEVIRWRLYVPE